LQILIKKITFKPFPLKLLNQIKIWLGLPLGGPFLEGGVVRHNFERGPPMDHPCQIWFNLDQGFKRRFKSGLLSKYT
jgi:hypothetical protein